MAATTVAAMQRHGVRRLVVTSMAGEGDSAANRSKAHSITRPDLAAFLVAQLTSDDHLRQAVTIVNR